MFQIEAVIPVTHPFHPTCNFSPLYETKSCV